MFAHHHIQRERLSVRERMGDILSSLEQSSFVEFVHLFRAEEGRMGITVTFVAILELVREGLIDIVQAEPFAPLHVRAATPNRHLRVVTTAEGDEAVQTPRPRSPCSPMSAQCPANPLSPIRVASAGRAVAEGAATPGEAVRPTARRRRLTKPSRCGRPR